MTSQYMKQNGWFVSWDHGGTGICSLLGPLGMIVHEF